MTGSVGGPAPLLNVGSDPDIHDLTNLARTISVPARRINEVVHGKRAITPDTALRLSRASGTSDRFWMNLQTHYDLEMAIDEHRAEFDQITPLRSA